MIWSWMVVSLLECSVWTSLRPKILSRIIWKVSRGIDEDNEALFLPWPPPLLEEDSCPSTSVSMSAGGACSGSSSSSSPGRWTLLLRIVWELMEGGTLIRLISYGVSTPFSWRILIIKLGRRSFALRLSLLLRQWWWINEHRCNTPTQLYS